MVGALADRIFAFLRRFYIWGAGVPPNTFLPPCFLNATAHHATHPKKKRWKAISQDAGCETRPGPTGTVAV